MAEKLVRINVQVPAGVHNTLRQHGIPHGLGLSRLVPAALALVVSDAELLARVTAAALAEKDAQHAPDA